MAANVVSSGPQAHRPRGRVSTWLQIVLALMIVIPTLGTVFQFTAGALDAQRFPPPGRMVDVGGHRLHLLVTGEQHSGPTVLLEAGAFSAAPQWEWVQAALAERYRVVAYDRPGLGWSDSDPYGFDPERIAGDLHTALAKEGISGPYILVGHSLGGLFVRVFAGQYPAEIAGMVLVDASHPDQAERSASIAATMTDFLRPLQALPLLSRFGVARLIDTSGPLTQGASPETQAIFRSFLGNSRHLSTMVDELNHAAVLNAAARAAGDLGALPLIVLSADDMGDVPTPAQYRRDWHRLHGELAALSSRGEQRIIPGTTHLSLVFDRDHAAAVIDAVNTVALMR